MSLNKHLPLLKPSHADAVHIYIVIGWIVLVQLRTQINLSGDDYSIYSKGYQLATDSLLLTKKDLLKKRPSREKF